MSTSRPFAYNTGSAIDGTTQVGSLAVGWPTNGFGSTGLTWWNGPDEDLGYVVARSVPGNTQHTPIPGVSASVAFRRSTSKTDQSFLDLANAIAGTSFIDADAAKTWLNTNGYWTSWGGVITNNLSLHLDAGNASSYPGSGSTWTDLVGSKTFTLFNSPTYSSSNGGYLSFSPSSSQYAESSTSLSNLSTWSVEVWHYYTGTNTGPSPCIVTEKWPNTTSNLNYTLGNGNDSSPNLHAGFFNGAWRITPNGYTLTANNWYHIVGTYDGSTIKLYTNNSLVQSTSYSGTPISGTQGIRLMRRWDNTEYWGGRLGVVRIYSNDIGSSGVTQNWNAQRSRFGL
jgi:hypothetical protein